MENGYYLSLYVSVGELTHLKALFVKHDQNIALFKKKGKKVKLVRYWELERVTGLKQHNRSFYNIEHLKNVCNILLTPLGLNLDDMKGIYGYPEVDTDGEYRKNISKDIAFHSILHLYTGLFVDSNLFFNNKLLCMAVDGGPDGVLDDGMNKHYHYCGMYVDHGKTSEIFDILSPGILWAYMAKKFGLREGTLMALGSATTARLLEAEYDEIYNIYNDHQGEKIYFEKIDKLYDRVKYLTVADDGIEFEGYDNRFSLEENLLSMVVKVVQQISINIMEYNVKQIIAKFCIAPNEVTLCITGGYALNCGTNSYLMSKFGFKQFIAPPCVNDSGLSLGLGMYIFYLKQKEFEFKLKNAYYGERFDGIKEEILQGFGKYVKSIDKVDDEKIVEDIIENPIVWFDGCAEIGPRALGHRSLLADPRRERSKDRLNEIKKRQWWRPVAPIIMLEYLNEWFEDITPSPFMLQTFKIKEEKYSQVPAIKHLDHSARVQTMCMNDNKRLYKVLSAFYRKTGVPILCNTSLNDKGEPIINKVEEAINFALRKNIRIMYINGLRMELINHSEYPENTYLPRSIHFLQYNSENEKDRMIKELNPLELSDELLKWRYRFYSFRDVDISKEEDVNKMKRIVDRLKNITPQTSIEFT